MFGGRKSTSPERSDSPDGKKVSSGFFSPRGDEPVKPAPVPYKAADLKELTKTTYFDEKEIKALGEMYRR